MSRPIRALEDTATTDVNLPPRSSSAMSHRRSQSTLPSPAPKSTHGGRPLIQHPLSGERARNVSTSTTASSNSTTGTYWERGQRWMEKQEAHSLREALEDMDLKEQTRLHSAAQEEASELVWKHQNPGAPYRNPEAPYNYRQHLVKGAYVRSQSSGLYSGLSIGSPLKTQSHRSASNDSTEGNHSSVSFEGSRLASGVSPKQVAYKTANPEKPTGKGHAIWDSPQKKAYMNLTSSGPGSLFSTRRKSSGQKSRNISGDSGKGLFRNPKDQIYEEPEEVSQALKGAYKEANTAPIPLHSKSRNTATRVHFTHDTSERSMAAPGMDTKTLSKFDIHKNPPSKSRDPSYVSNALPPTPPDSASASDSDLIGTSDKPLMKNGIEVRGEDIRAATSMRLKDRSPKLPTPTVVSDRPGRPIVSFDHDWKPKEMDLKQSAPGGQRRVSRDSLNKALPGLPSKPRFPQSIASAPVVPTLNLPKPPEIQINTVSTPSFPTINVSDTPSVSNPPIPSVNAPNAQPSARPLPTPTVNTSKGRPFPHHSSTAPIQPTKSHWSPLFARRPTAQCAQCALPISGRIVSAAGQRFHPECFVCYHCGEALECVAFYPEPDTKREERVARIQGRVNGQPIEEKEGSSEVEDGDEGLRFYCHLDFHEFFSPRCRSCKTPIEGEVVVACGGEWHVGHFFCAECGDVSCNLTIIIPQGFHHTDARIWHSLSTPPPRSWRKTAMLGASTVTRTVTLRNAGNADVQLRTWLSRLLALSGMAIVSAVW